MATERLFLAWPITESSCYTLLAAREKWLAANPSVRIGNPSPAENLHLTLAFLGSVKSEQIKPLIEQLERLPWNASPIAGVAVTNIAPFPHAHSRLLAAHAQNNSAMQALHDQVWEALQTLGFGRDHPAFRPHITLARELGNTRDARTLGIQSDIALLPVTLFASISDHNGVHYEPRWCCERH